MELNNIYFPSTSMSPPASFSMEGSKIIYSSIREGKYGIYFKPVDADVRQLTGHDRFTSDRHPMPTPDGKSVVFSRHSGGVSSLYIQTLEEAGTPLKLTNGDSFEDYPHFSPDGQYLYFTCDKDGASHIYRVLFTAEGVDIDQSEQITSGDNNEYSFDISPDGQEIVFCSDRDNRGAFEGASPSPTYRAGQLFRMTIGSVNPARLLVEPRSSHWQGTPCWNNEGTYYYQNGDSGMRMKFHTADGEADVSDHVAFQPTNTPEGNIAYVRETLGKDGGKSSWSIERRLNDDTVVEDMSNVWGPRYLDNGSIVAYGTTPVSPDTSYLGQVWDQGEKHGIYLQGIDGYFAAYATNKGSMAVIQEMQRIVKYGYPHGELELVFQPPKGQMVFGLSSSDNGVLVSSVGIPFGASDSVITVFEDQKEARALSPVGASNNVWPSINRTGDRVVFSRGTATEKALYSIGIDGQNFTQLTDDRSQRDVMPSFSYDGTKLAYSSSADAGKTYQVRIFDLNNEKIRVVTSGWADTHPCLSPDGNYVAFSSNRLGLHNDDPTCRHFGPQKYGDIFIGDLRSRDVFPLTRSPFEDSLPLWIRV